MSCIHFAVNRPKRIYLHSHRYHSFCFVQSRNSSFEAKNGKQINQSPTRECDPTFDEQTNLSDGPNSLLAHKNTPVNINSSQSAGRTWPNPEKRLIKPGAGQDSSWNPASANWPKAAPERLSFATEPLHIAMFPRERILIMDTKTPIRDNFVYA